MHSSGLEAAHGMGVVPRPPAPPPAPPITPEAAAGPTLQEAPNAGSSMTAASYGDDNDFFRQMKRANSLVETLPSAPAPIEKAADHVNETRSSVSLEAELMRAAGRPFAGLFHAAEAAEVDEEEEPKAGNKMRNLALAGAGVLVLFFGFHMIQGRTATKPAAAPHPAPALTQPDSSAPKPSPANGAYQGTQSSQSNSNDEPAIRLSTLDTPQASNSRPASVASRATPPPVQSQMMHDQLTAPNMIPQSLKKEGVAEPPPASDFSAAGAEGEGSNGSLGNVFKGHSKPTVTTVPAKPLSISAGVAVGLLIKKTDPIYPPIAKSARVSGTVVLQATISKSGAITNLHVVSGPSMLRQAATDAVRSWRYRPYKLNNDPIDVDTTVNLVFTLGS